MQDEGDETIVSLCLEYTMFNPDLGRKAFHVGFFNTKFPAFPYVPCTPSRPMHPISLPCEYNNTFPQLQNPVNITTVLKKRAWTTSLAVATRAAAETAYAELHGHGLDDSSPFFKSPLFQYSMARLQILITGYCVRVAETMSYRTGKIPGHTGWSWFNRALRDTFLVPSNTFFRLDGPPNNTDAGPSPQLDEEAVLAELLLPVLLTHGLCNWFLKFFNSMRAGGDKGFNDMMHPGEISFEKIVRE